MNATGKSVGVDQVPSNGKQASGPRGSLSLAVVVDRACMQILKAWEEGAEATALRVNPEVYEVIASARLREVQQGYPLMLLDLDLVCDEQVAAYEPIVTR